MKLKAGVKKDGTLTALELRCSGTGGAYPAGGTSLVDWLVRDLYPCPNVRTETTDVYINAGPARAFRAPGHPAGRLGARADDGRARRGDRDGPGRAPAEEHLRPSARPGRDGRRTPRPASSACLTEGAKAFGWDEAREEAARREGRSGAASAWPAGLWMAGSGGPPSTVIVKLFADGSANLNMGARDIGTGTKTVMAMVVAEELGVPLEKIQIENADTGTTQFATASGGSKTVPTESPAVRDGGARGQAAAPRDGGGGAQGAPRTS